MRGFNSQHLASSFSSDKWLSANPTWPGKKAGSTLRTSQAVPHPSTNRALCRLTSEVGRDPVHSTRYGRQRALKSRMYLRAVRSRALRPSRALRWGVARPRAHPSARSPARLQARAAYSPSFLPTDRADLSARHLIHCQCLSRPLAACQAPSKNVQGTTNEPPRNLQGTCRGPSRNPQGTCGEPSKGTQGDSRGPRGFKGIQRGSKGIQRDPMGFKGAQGDSKGFTGTQGD